ncbi:MAG: peptide deformylase [Lysobacterales bacterium]|jgi:peptide deformylase
MLEILEYPDPRLRTKAKPVNLFDAELGELIDEMLGTMYAANGIGLAATQVNQHIRLLVLDVSEGRDQPHVYINTEIISRDGEQVCEEGCLSVPGIYANVSRSNQIRIRSQNRNGDVFEQDADGLHAVCLQHEMDHLEGKLFVDYLSPLKRRMVRKKLEKSKKQELQDKPAGSLI